MALRIKGEAKPGAMPVATSGQAVGLGVITPDQVQQLKDQLFAYASAISVCVGNDRQDPDGPHILPQEVSSWGAFFASVVVWTKSSNTILSNASNWDEGVRLVKQTNAWRDKLDGEGVKGLPPSMPEPGGTVDPSHLPPPGVTFDVGTGGTIAVVAVVGLAALLLLRK